MGVTGHEGADPVRVGTSLIDMGTGMWAVIGVLAALRRRDATGQGGRIAVSLYETALGWTTYHVSGFLASGRDPKRPGTRSPGSTEERRVGKGCVRTGRFRGTPNP